MDKDLKVGELILQKQALENALRNSFHHHIEKFKDQTGLQIQSVNVGLSKITRHGAEAEHVLTILNVDLYLDL